MSVTDPYENEKLDETCTRISEKLKPKCEIRRTVDGVETDCLERKELFEARCSICQARGLLNFLRSEADTIEQADRLNAKLEASRRVHRNFASNLTG